MALNSRHCAEVPLRNWSLTHLCCVNCRLNVVFHIDLLAMHVLSDMKEERSWLVREGVPQLHQLARDTGLIIHMVDLLWGLPEDTALDPELYSVYLDEINNSRQYSAGPFFAVSAGIGIGCGSFGWNPLYIHRPCICK